MTDDEKNDALVAAMPLVEALQAAEVEIERLERERRPGNQADRRAVQRARRRSAAALDRLCEALELVSH